MTKQEEIKKGIEDIISDKGYYFPVDEATEDILAYLDKEDVVIKLDRELPYMRTIPANAKYTKTITVIIPDWWDDVAMVSYLTRITQQDMLKAGYAAVEPLIEEKHD